MLLSSSMFYYKPADKDGWTGLTFPEFHGAGTCHVNARYITLPKGVPYRFHLLLTIGNLNNEGKVFVYNTPIILDQGVS